MAWGLQQRKQYSKVLKSMGFFSPLGGEEDLPVPVGCSRADWATQPWGSPESCSLITSHYPLKLCYLANKQAGRHLDPEITSSSTSHAKARCAVLLPS